MDTLTRSGVSAIVEYDYTAKEPDELDLTKGAILHSIKVQSGGWWEGTLAANGKSGMFPDNFVRVLDADDKSPVVLRDKSATSNRRCKVVYSYTQHNDDELSLVVGNIIEVLGEVEEGWWRGKLGDKVGVFPSNFVEPIEASPILANKRSHNSTKKDNRSSLHSSREDLLSSSPLSLDKDAPLLPPKPIREYCRVLFPYDPQNEDELELQIGEIITIINKELPDKGWWRGEIRGKVGVFPDNFVNILPPEVSPSKDGQHPDRPPPGSSKIFIKKSGSGSSSQGSTRKDSFGSRDSLNDILSETGIITGNVAAQRKSLENKNFDLTVTNDARTTRRSLETKTTEIRKSIDTMDEKKTPPPVLTKKPVVPVKKSATVTSVAGNLLSGLKQKVKLASHDSMDGVVSSKSSSQIPDNSEKGIVGEKLRKDDLDFDNVERGSMLQDMRAGRAKAPKRRPPSAAINILGESNNNNSIYLNGGGSYASADTSTDDSRTDITETEELAKPKPREWEKKKAPWMAELKASQAKKTSPSVEPRASERIKHETSSSSTTSSTDVSNRTVITQDKSDMSKSVITSSSSNTSYIAANQRKSTESVTSSSFEARTSFDSNVKKEPAAATSSATLVNDMSKSMSILASKAASVSDSAILDDNKSRPTSLSIRNRSVSPIGRTSLGKSSSTTTTTTTTATAAATSATMNTNEPTTASRLSTSSLPPSSQVNNDNVCARVVLLEQRVSKLEGLVHTQNNIIEELIRSLKEETDKVKGLKTELDKYAQCVTQV